MIVLALFAPVIAKATGHGPNDLFQSQTLDSFGLPKQGPSGSFLFGADQSGRDVFVRIAYGARISLLVGLVATAIAVVVGTVLGVLAGYRGGWADTMISRGVDILVSMPLIIFGIGIVAACSGQQGCLNGQLHPGLPLVIVIVALFSWPYVARLVRGQTLSLREKEFVEASRSLGMSETGIMFREILPNLVAPLIVYSSLLIPSNILFEAYLAFLGLGLPSTTPSWGRMLSDATDLLDTAWWLWLFPGVFLVLTVLAFNLLGDGLRDALDPRTGR